MGQKVKIGGNELVNSGEMQLVRVGHIGLLRDGLRGDVPDTELCAIPLLCLVCLP